MKEEKNTTKDIWDKADVIVKASATLLVSGAIALYGITSEKKKTEIAEENRRSQIIMQTMNSRETAVADMRAKMFDTLMTHYFVGPGGESPNEKNKLRILQLIALNFQDNFQLTPLFEDLYASLGNNPEAKGELRKVVRAIARARRQRRKSLQTRSPNERPR
jgi:hypothetical protein